MCRHPSVLCEVRLIAHSAPEDPGYDDAALIELTNRQGFGRIGRYLSVHSLRFKHFCQYGDHYPF